MKGLKHTTRRTRHTPSYSATSHDTVAPRAHRSLGIANPTAEELAFTAWHGPIERRDPATYQTASQVQTWMCVNPFCRQWTMDDAHERGRCNFCQTPRGER